MTRTSPVVCLSASLVIGAVMFVPAQTTASPLAGRFSPPAALFEGTPRFLIPVQEGEGSEGSEGEESSGSYENEPGDGEELDGPTAELNDAETGRVSTSIEGAAQICAQLSGGYRASCMGGELRRIAESMREGGPYSEARAALIDASEKLDAIVAANRDPTAPVVQPRVRRRDGQPGRPATVAPLTAVVQTAEVQRATEAVLEEASTVLLRAAVNSTRQRSHLLQIAQSLETAKVLLRSA